MANDTVISTATPIGYPVLRHLGMSNTAQSSAGKWSSLPDWEPDSSVDAPGAPGIAPTWTSSAKDMVGCSLGPARLWFTIGYGIVNEVYWPRVDTPQIRDLGFLVGDGRGFWVEVKRLGEYSIKAVAPGAAASEIIHAHPRFTLRLVVTPDPLRDILAIEAILESEDAALGLYALLAPRLGATGHGNRAMVARHRGRTVLWAERGPFALALAAVDPNQQDAIARASAGYVGFSDGWQDFARNGAMTWTHSAAGPGNVALMAELPRRCVIALGFGSSPEAAATLALSSLAQPFENLLAAQVADWDRWHRRCGECCARPHDVPAELQDQFSVSTIVLRAHLDKTYPGAMVASLSVPWGDSGEERGGYHLVWPRDLVQCAGALLALGGEQEARDTLRYLIATQTADGHWHQNYWLGGHPYWHGVQLDEIAFPILLAAALAERNALSGIEVANMVRRALAFIVGHGPTSDQDRWEENSGINCFTLATCISALVAGSVFLDENAKQWALDIADFWNSRIEEWTAVLETGSADGRVASGHFVRTAPSSVLRDPKRALADPVPIRNRADGLALPAGQQVSTDFLQLVRFGLRSADDPTVKRSVELADRLLKVDTPAGPVWKRYNGDGYGEHEDGSPFDGTGQGRPWPLLTGERGHYELAAGRDPLPYLSAMAGMASPGGMIPEQVWDSASIASRRLHLGRPTGSAMPLAWAHAEFVKLIVSRTLGRPFDQPDAVWRRYRGQRRGAQQAFWWMHARMGAIGPGQRLVVALQRSGFVRWTTDGWRSFVDTPAVETGLGFFAAPLDTTDLKSGQSVDLTIRWNDTEWVGENFTVAISEHYGALEQPTKNG